MPTYKPGEKVLIKSDDDNITYSAFIISYNADRTDKEYCIGILGSDDIKYCSEDDLLPLE